MDKGVARTFGADPARRAKCRGKALRQGLLTGGLCLAVLSACTIEMGPPPESDPPLVSEAQRKPPPPPQPTEPQAWSKDLDFEGGERRFERDQLAEGLVAGDQAPAYSAERLTFESAQSTERPPTEAELIRERARQRLLEAQGRSGGTPAPPAVDPPRVAAAPVETVSAEALPPQGEGPGEGPTKEATAPGDVSQEADGAAAAGRAPEPIETAAKPARQRPSLPPPPTIPAQEPATQVAAAEPTSAPAPAVQEQAAAPEPVPAQQAEPVPGPQAKLSTGTAVAEESAPIAPAATSAGPVSDPAVDFWDAPTGTILVQISAIQDQDKVAGEWDRLKRGYPEVLGPLRLVVEEAKLGERGVFFRVQAGGFASQLQAEDACSALTEQGQPCFVVERP